MQITITMQKKLAEVSKKKLILSALLMQQLKQVKNQGIVIDQRNKVW